MGKLAEHPHSRRPPDERQKADRLRNERRKLAARLQKVDAELAKLGGSHHPDRAPTALELERWFSDLSAGLPELPPLPTDFSRADIYDDHD
jgi:hypothetical protein